MDESAARLDMIYTLQRENGDWICTNLQRQQALEPDSRAQRVARGAHTELRVLYVYRDRVFRSVIVWCKLLETHEQIYHPKSESKCQLRSLGQQQTRRRWLAST